jgi:hypothetical protein
MILPGFKTALAAVMSTVLFFYSAAAGAHNFHMGIADISYNAASGSTEIVHTYTAHDVEALLADLYQRQFDLGQPEDEKLLRRYVERQFFIADANGKRLAVNWIGVKVNSDNITVFQEIEKTRLAPGTTIHNQVLIDFMPSQKNTLNVQGEGAVQTLFFDSGHADLLTR